MIQVKRGSAAVIDINPLSSSAYTKAVMGEEEITLVWEAPAFTQLNIGDYIVYEGANFTLNQLPTVKKLSTRLWQYNAVFQSTKYDLAKAIYMLFDNTGTLPSGEFSLTGTADTFLDLLISNLNRVAGSALWSKGQVLADTEYVDLTFSNEDCLSVLGRLADEFDTEYHVSNRVIHLDKISAAREITLEYGSTIYDIERIAVDSSDIVTRLYPFGSTKNLATNYRGGNSPLRLPEEIGNYIESNVDLYGVIEGSKTFEDIYPRLSSGGAGTVTAVGNEFTFTDTALDFDVNTCLMDGTTAKVHFNTGECAGYDFEIKSYVHATKTFVIIANSMENDLALPAADLTPVVGDKYVLLDIVMPAAYLAAAEAELLAKSQELIAANSTPKVNYKATFSSLYARENLQNVECGDTVTITDDDMGISEPIRIIKLTKAISEYWNVQLDLANAVSKTTLQRITGDVSQLQNNVVTTNERINRSNLLAYRNNKELREMIFDPEGYFDPENIKPLSIETSMLSVGSKSQSLQLSCILQPNYTGNAQILQCSAGVLAHFTIDETQIKEWVIGAGIITITGGNQTAALYIYARCARSGSTGDIYLSPTAIKFDSDATNWMFLIGVLHSPASGVRGISLTYGMTTVNGQFIKTGVISSADGATWFNLNTGEIAGNIKFKSGETYKEVGSAIQTAVNEVTVGGRNLIINSNMEATSSDDSICPFYFGNEKPVAGEYMLSLKGELTDAQQTGFYINVDDNSGSYPGIAVFGNNDKGIDGIYRKKVTIPAMQNPITFGVAYALPVGLGKQATMHWMKLEKGNKATDWTPAPEDVQAGIDNAQNTANSANQSVTTLNDYVDGAFKDGVVSQAEAKAIEKYLNSVSTEYDKAISSYEVVYANSYLEGTPKATLLNSKITLAGTKDALVFSINTAILDGKTTPAEKTDVDAKYGLYKSAFTTYATALENANKAIQTKLDNLSTDKVNNVKIGGRNLLKNTSTIVKFVNAYGYGTSDAGSPTRIIENDYYLLTCTAVGFTNNYYFINSGLPPMAEGEYIFSFDVMTNTDKAQLLFMPNFSNAGTNTNIPNTAGKWVRINTIATIPTGQAITGNTFFSIEFCGAAVGDFVKYKNIQLERGNKTTDWTPAPEDVQSSIDNLNSYVDGAFKDGVVSEAEAKAIAKYINTVNTEFESAIAGYDVVYANSYLTGTEKTTLLNAKITLSGAKDNLITSINTAILDGKTTPAEKTDVDAKYGLYKSAFTTYATALENANKAIQQKLDSLGTDKVNNIVIGGKNLVRNSATAQGGSTSFFAFNAPGDFDSGMSPIFDENGVGIYAFSFDIRTDVAGEVLFYSMPGDAVLFRYVWDWQLFNTTTNWQRIKLIRNVTLNNPDAPITTLAFYGYNVPGVFPQIRNFKIEKGNKATDWSPAPEDVQSDINAALAKAAEADYLKAAIASDNTTIEGGLLGTTLLQMKNGATNEITGGMSGIQADNIGFWTGGTYADAIANLANIILRKDGSGQLAGGSIKWDASGSLLEVIGRILAQSGKIGGLDIFADTLKSNTMSFTENPVETLAALLSPLTVSIGNQSSWSNSQTNAEAHAYTQALAVTVDSQIKFKATATPDPALNDRNWLVYLNDSSGNRVFSQSGSGSISNQLFTVNVPAGTYTIHATAGGLMNLGQTYTNSANITGETSSTIIATGYSYQTKIGNNGFYSFWNVLQYLYYSSAQGLKVRGAVDMPAGLGGASVTSGGSVSGTWGKVTGCSRSGSTVTINHSGIGDSKYTVQVSPNGSSTWYFQNRTDSSIQVVCSGTFDFILVRTPY